MCVSSLFRRTLQSINHWRNILLKLKLGPTVEKESILLVFATHGTKREPGWQASSFQTFWFVSPLLVLFFICDKAMEGSEAPTEGPCRAELLGTSVVLLKSAEFL